MVIAFLMNGLVCFLFEQIHGDLLDDALPKAADASVANGTSDGPPIWIIPVDDGGVDKDPVFYAFDAGYLAEGGFALVQNVDGHRDLFAVIREEGANKVEHSVILRLGCPEGLPIRCCCQ